MNGTMYQIPSVMLGKLAPIAVRTMARIAGIVGNLMKSATWICVPPATALSAGFVLVDCLEHSRAHTMNAAEKQTS